MILWKDTYSVSGMDMVGEASEGVGEAVLFQVNFMSTTGCVGRGSSSGWNADVRGSVVEGIGDGVAVQMLYVSTTSVTFSPCASLGLAQIKVVSLLPLKALSQDTRGQMLGLQCHKLPARLMVVREIHVSAVCWEMLLSLLESRFRVWRLGRHWNVLGSSISSSFPETSNFCKEVHIHGRPWVSCLIRFHCR